MWNRVSVLVPPASPVDTLVGLDVLRSQCSIDDGESEADLTRWLRTAVAMIESRNGLGWALLTQTWRLTLDRFEPCIRLPGCPVKSIVAVRYVAPDGTETALDETAWRFVAGIHPARLTAAWGTVWPATRPIVGAVEIDYMLGEASGDLVDPRLLDAIALLVGQRDAYREAIGRADLAALPFGLRAHLADLAQCMVAG